MKRNKKLLAVFLAVIMAFGLLPVSVISSFAVTKIEYGDFYFVKNSDGTYSVYEYFGESSDVVLPDTVFGKSVTAVYSHAFEDSSITSVTIPEGYVTIGSSAFYGCSNLTEITLPSTITAVESMAFNSCTSLETVDLSAATSLKTVSYAVFQGDSALSSVVIPESVETLGANVFNGCSSLSEAVLPDGITSLGDNLFNGCSSLETVNIPSKVTKIGDNAFNGCALLDSISLPKDLTSIGENAFMGCASISDFEVPNKLTSIGASAFEDCSSLSELFIPDTVTSIGANVFYPMSVQNKINITCYENSEAETYCNENFVPFTAIEKKMGDVNIDGLIDINDVTAIQKYRIGIATITTYRQMALADVSHDGAVTIRDATLIQMKIAKMDVDFQLLIKNQAL